MKRTDNGLHNFFFFFLLLTDNKHNIKLTILKCTFQ